MANFLNRLKNLKTNINSFNNNESDNASICSFDEEGFLCPVCRRKFADTAGLEHHYLQAHAEPQQTPLYEEANGAKYDQHEDPHQEVTVWKQQFFQSEESRMQLSSELMQQRQRVGDLEEELDLLHKQVQSTQMKVIEQSQEIGNLKASKDVYDAQLAIFTDELLNTQGELKEKQSQVDTLRNDLIPRPTTDDVDVLKRELITVQQHMNEMSLEKEQQIERLRSFLSEIEQSVARLDQLDSTFEQNTLSYEAMIDEYTSQVESDLNAVKQFVGSTRERKQNIVASLQFMRNRLSDSQAELDQLKQANAQLHVDLEQRNQLNEQLTNDLQNEQNSTNSNRVQIDTLTNEIHELEKALEEIKQEKNQLLVTKMDGDQDEDRQNLVRQLTQEKDQYEQQMKELRKQIKQLNEEKGNTQKDFEAISRQLTQITEEKNQLQEEQTKSNNEIQSLRQQLDELNRDKEQQIRQLEEALSSTREQHLTTNSKLEDNLREANDTIVKQKSDVDRLQNELQETSSQFAEQINQLNQKNTELRETTRQQEESLDAVKSQLETVQQEKTDLEKHSEDNGHTIDELQQTVSQLRTKLNEKDAAIDCLSDGIRRSLALTQKTNQYIQQTILPNQINIYTMIEQSEQESQAVRTRTLEDIRNEFTSYLTAMHAVIVAHKSELDQQIIEERQRADQQLTDTRDEHSHVVKEYEEQKQRLETQLSELKTNLSQVSDSLYEATQAADLLRQNFEEQLASLQRALTDTQSDLESRTKKYDMQTSALRENLATVRSELKSAQEKLVNFEKVKSEKADLEARLAASQDECQTLLERTSTSDNRNEKLLFENGQLARKNSDLESALQEIAREYQGLQIHTNKITQRRWLNDSDVHECMKCNQVFTLRQRKHHCRSCGNIFCDTCSSKTAIVAATSNKPQRVCDQCYKELTS